MAAKARTCEGDTKNQRFSRAGTGDAANLWIRVRQQEQQRLEGRITRASKTQFVAEPTAANSEPIRRPTKRQLREVSERERGTDRLTEASSLWMLVERWISLKTRLCSCAGNEPLRTNNHKTEHENYVKTPHRERNAATQ